MFELLRGALEQGLPNWARLSPDFCRLHALESVLHGRQYEGLSYPFWQDTVENTEQYIPIAKRRPHVTVNIARGLARKVARKMFAGRQRPTLFHEDGDAVAKIDAFLREGFFEQRLLNAVFLGSVGAAAMTFSFLKDGAGNLRVVFNTHAATECLPEFDALGELVKLRIQYVCQGMHFMRMGYRKDSRGEDISKTGRYWYVCDYDRTRVCHYVPAREDDYSPFDIPQFPEGAPELREDDTIQPAATHNLGFVPAHWFCSMSLGPLPWGGCYWESGMNTATVMDYTASQLMRSLWYAGHPTLVVQGKLLNAGGGLLVRSPDHALHFDVEKRDAAANSVGGGDAKLLESNGHSFSETREGIELLRKIFMEQVQGSRKDPDRMRTTAMSGAAMDSMDDDLVDLMQAMRTDYGEQGMLVVIKKALAAAKKVGHPLVTGIDDSVIGGLALMFPPPFGLSAQETLQLVQAVVLATTGQQAGGGAGGGKGDGEGGGAPPGPKVDPPLQPEEGREMLITALNIPQLTRTPSRAQVPRVGDKEAP